MSAAQSITLVIVTRLFPVSLILLLLLYVFDQPVHRGFFCDDESIRYPVPKYQTVSDITVGVVAVGVPIIVVRAISRGIRIRLLSLSVSTVNGTYNFKEGATLKLEIKICSCS